MADDEEQPDGEDETDFPDPQPSTPIDVPDLRVETNVDLTPNEPEPEPPPEPVVPQFIPPMLPPPPVSPAVNQPPEQPAPQPVRQAQANAPPMPPDPYDTRSYGGSPPTHPMPPDKYDPFPKAQGPGHPEQNSLWGAINQLFDWLNITHRKLHEVWPRRDSPSEDSATGTGNLRECDCQNDGGSGGNATTKCSFTYIVTDTETGEVVGTGIALTGNGRRDATGAMFPGTHGMYRMTADGDVRLLYVDESAYRRSCTPP